MNYRILQMKQEAIKTKISILCMIVPFNFSREFVSMHETQLDSRILNFI